MLINTLKKIESSEAFEIILRPLMAGWRVLYEERLDMVTIGRAGWNGYDAQVHTL